VAVAGGVIAVGLTITPDDGPRAKRRAAPQRLAVVDDVEARAIEQGAVVVLEAAPEPGSATPTPTPTPTPVEVVAAAAAEPTRAAPAAVRELDAPAPAEARVLAEAPPEPTPEPARELPPPLPTPPVPPVAERFDAGVDGAAVLSAIEHALAPKPTPTPTPAAANKPARAPVELTSARAPEPTRAAAVVPANARAAAVEAVARCRSMKSCAERAIAALAPHGGVPDATTLEPVTVANFESARLAYRKTQGAVLRAAKKLAGAGTGQRDSAYFREVFEAMPRSEQWELEAAELGPTRRVLERSVTEWLRAHRLSPAVPIALEVSLLTPGETELAQLDVVYRREGVAGMDDLVAKMRQDLLASREVREASRQQMARVKLILNPGGTIEVR
jgi:hypothetical protein